MRKIHRLRLSILLLGIGGNSIVYAMPAIGITQLFYISNYNSHTTTMHTESSVNILQLNHNIYNKVINNLTNFAPNLQMAVEHSKQFNIFNVTTDTEIWRKKMLINKWETEAGTYADNKPTLNEIHQAVADSDNLKQQLKDHNNIIHKYILVGFVTAINLHEIKQPYYNTNQTSILYNVDIHIFYKIIDYSTHQVVTRFNITGHGGTAQIMPINQTFTINNSEQLADTIVANTIDSLVKNVVHELLLNYNSGNLL